MAKEAGRNYTNAANYEEQVIGDLLNNIDQKDCNQKGWIYVDTYTSPYYPFTHPTNCNINVKKSYGDDVKNVLIDVRNVQLEGGCSYDYMLIKDMEDTLVGRICDAFNGSFAIPGNVLNYSFITDHSVCRRGFLMDIYVLKEDKPIQEYSSTYGLKLTNKELEKEEVKVYRLPFEKNLRLRPTLYRKNEEEWIEDDSIDPNAVLTVSCEAGNVLYSREIHNNEEFNIDISKFPSFFIVNLERKDIAQYSMDMRIMRLLQLFGYGF